MHDLNPIESEDLTSQTVDNKDVNSDEEKGANVPKTFTQEEVDNLIKNRLAREKNKWQKQLDDDKTEAEKLANMTEKQKKEYELEKRLKALEDREKAITQKELEAQAKTTLLDKGIPSELSSFLNYSNADECSKSIDVLSKAFQTAVEKQVENALKGKGAPKKAPQNNEKTQQDEVYNAMMGKY